MFHELPLELCQLVISMLPLDSIAKCALVCKEFASVVADDCFWEAVAKRLDAGWQKCEFLEMQAGTVSWKSVVKSFTFRRLTMRICENTDHMVFSEYGRVFTKERDSEYPCSIEVSPGIPADVCSYIEVKMVWVHERGTEESVTVGVRQKLEHPDAHTSLDDPDDFSWSPKNEGMGIYYSDGSLFEGKEYIDCYWDTNRPKHVRIGIFSEPHPVAEEGPELSFLLNGRVLATFGVSDELFGHSGVLIVMWTDGCVRLNHYWMDASGDNLRKRIVDYYEQHPEISGEIM